MNLWQNCKIQDVAIGHHDVIITWYDAMVPRDQQVDFRKYYTLYVLLSWLNILEVTEGGGLKWSNKLQGLNRINAEKNSWVSK